MYRYINKLIYLIPTPEVTREVRRKMSVDEFVEICKRLNWNVVDESERYFELQKYSPAGEDYSIPIEKDNFMEDVYNAWANFDIDEHAAGWYEAGKNGRRGVPSLSTLVWDAEQISKMLEQLYYATIR